MKTTTALHYEVVTRLGDFKRYIELSYRHYFIASAISQLINSNCQVHIQKTASQKISRGRFSYPTLVGEYVDMRRFAPNSAYKKRSLTAHELGSYVIG